MPILEPNSIFRNNEVSLPNMVLRLSVVMPAKNAGLTIRVAVRSALLAMPRDSELLVLLDDCTDDTFEKLSTIRDRRLRVLNPGGKFGLTAARNLLHSEAKAAYVGVLDADDICLPWRFFFQLRKLEKGLDVICGTALVFGKALRSLPLIPQLPMTITEREFPLFLTTSNPVVHSTVTYRKSLVDSVGGYPGTWPREDYHLWIKLAKANARMARGAAAMALYRFHPNQVSHSSPRAIDPVVINEVEREISGLVQHLGLADAIQDRQAMLYSMKPLAKMEQRGLRGLNARKRKQAELD